jgi:hypothetical protein
MVGRDELKYVVGGQSHVLIGEQQIPLVDTHVLNAS